MFQVSHQRPKSECFRCPTMGHGTRLGVFSIHRWCPTCDWRPKNECFRCPTMGHGTRLGALLPVHFRAKRLFDFCFFFVKTTVKKSTIKTQKVFIVEIFFFLLSRLCRLVRPRARRGLGAVRGRGSRLRGRWSFSPAGFRRAWPRGGRSDRGAGSCVPCSWARDSAGPGGHARHPRGCVAGLRKGAAAAGVRGGGRRVRGRMLAGR
jgi:hypothetical protein